MEVVNKPCRTTLRNGGSCFRSYLNRFISADTIIPQPTDPQSYNRYSYARNNPVNRTDPTGHIDVNCLEDCTPVATPQAGTPPTPLVLFDGIAGQEWTAAEMRAVREGALAVAEALARAINKAKYQEVQGMARRLGESFDYTPISPRDAFLAVYGGSVTFYKTGTNGCGTQTCYGEWAGNNTINVYTDIYDASGNSNIPDLDTSNRWAVHELGHGFEAHVNDVLGTEHIRNHQMPDEISNRNGFAGPYPGWQQSTCTIDCNGEIFADMFVGWTYGQWEVNPFTGALTIDASLKANFMSTNMSGWIDAVR